MKRSIRKYKEAEHPFSTEPIVCPFDQCDGYSNHEPIASGWDFEYQTTYAELTIVRCNDCGVIHPSQLPVRESMAVIYPPNYYSFSEKAHENPIVRLVRNWVARKKGRIFQELEMGKTAEVLEIGCGDGRLLDILHCACPSTWRYSGLDWSETAIAEIRSKGYDGRAGNIENLDIPDWDEKFDLILMHQVIEHVRFPRLVLEKIRTLLRPGGVLAIETPDIDAWDYRIFGKRYWAGYHIPRHFFIFNKANFTQLAQDTGYEVIRVRSIINPVAWIHSLKSFCADNHLFRCFVPYFHHQNPFLLALITPIELIQTLIFGKSSNMQFFLRKKR